MRVLDDVRSVLSPPHRAGLPFVGAGVCVALVGLFTTGWLVWLGLLFSAFCLYFFRNPERVTPTRPDAIVAPADGRVVLSGLAVPPEELGLGATPRWRVAIFLSVLDVHINRAPFTGVVTKIAYRPGKFVSASLDKASDSNERNGVALRLADGRQMAVVQIAGLIARRIICSLREGDAIQAGCRFGLIRFGSRTDLYLPEGVKPLVLPGQYMIGGETVVAEIDPC